VGSILSIQFFAIFDNLQRKKLRFSQKPMSWSNVCIILLCFESKRQFFANFFAILFGENTFKKS
jgi:hypothetical protein